MIGIGIGLFRDNNEGDDMAIFSGPVTDASGTIDEGGTSQEIDTINSGRKYFFIVNPNDATESLWFNFGVAAATNSPSIEIKPGGSFVMEAGFVSNQAINVIAATTGHAFTIKVG
jgi:hypothetical protein